MKGWLRQSLKREEEVKDKEMRSPTDVNVYVTVGKSRDTKSLDQAPTILSPMWARTDLGCCSYSSNPPKDYIICAERII